jgi:hypothetical protein
MPAPLMAVPHTRRWRPQTSKGTAGGACKWRGLARGIPIAVATQSRPVWRYSPQVLNFRLRVTCAHIHIEGLDRTVKALEHEPADRLGLCKLLDRREYLAVNQDLSVFRLGAQSRGKIDDRAVGRIVEPALATDAAERGVAVGDADPESELVTQLAPVSRKRGSVVVHRDGEPNGAQRRIDTWQRIIEQDHDAIAGKAVQGAFELVDEPAEVRVVLA